jgi:hypothetical protein
MFLRCKGCSVLKRIIITMALTGSVLGDALVAQQQALVGYKTITAPFSGRLGVRQVADEVIE